MKIRVIPDVHGYNWWKNLVTDIEDLDYIIFLGDYVDEWNLPNEKIINNLKDIIEFKKSNIDKVVLLYGNHEWNYINPYIGYCSGYRPSYMREINSLLAENKNLFNICKLINISLPLYSIPEQKLLFSHAGFTSHWINENYHWLNETHFNELDDFNDRFKDFRLPDLEEKINSAKDSDKILDKVMQISYLRGGRSQFGGPLWADKNESANTYLMGYHQFVGHTPLKAPITYQFKERKPQTSSITYCDCDSKEVDITIEITDKNIFTEWLGVKFTLL